MILIPYAVYKSQKANWLKIGIFLMDGGKALWDIGGDDPKAILADSGFPVKSVRALGDQIWAEIDSTRLDLTDFYTWDEVDPEAATQDLWKFTMAPSELWTDPVFQQHLWAQFKHPELAAGAKDMV
jgi:hypothetical protein